MLELAHIAEPLLGWFEGHARILPWREEPTPYRVWVSEIMLQQTRVEAVKPYFERFVRELPGIVELAAVPEDRLLKLWEGLGYYNRARNLKRAAELVLEEYDGLLPGEPEELRKLPGIGSYTAGAVSSIAFNHSAPAVDGNVLRVIARVMDYDGDILDSKVKKYVEDSLIKVIPPDKPGAFNQALMELGAMVCIPNGAAKCEECPWMTFCMARERGHIGDLPRKTKKKPRVIEEKTVLVIQDENKAALRKRPGKGLLAGMYEFPNLEGFLNQDQVLVYMEELGIHVIRVQPLEESRHIFTHREWHMLGYAVKVDELDKPGQGAGGLLFVEKEKTEADYPIPSAFRAYTKYLNIRQGSNQFQKDM